MATGERDLISFSDIKRPIQNALDEAQHTGLRIDDAVRLVRQAGEIIPISEILDACRFWKSKRPDKPFTPKTVREATSDFLARQVRLSARRRRVLKSYLGQLETKFGQRLLHELTTLEIKDWMDAKAWEPATFNSVLGAYALLFKDAQSRDRVPVGCNPIIGIKRFRIMAGQIGIMEPSEVRTIMSTVNNDLKPFLAIWFFAGCRKDEIARLDWRQIRAALKTGVLEIDAEQGLKTGARFVPVLPNLKSWLEWYLRHNPASSGLVLPLKYNGGRKLDNIQRTITRQSGVRWVLNAGRHSYISYRTKLADSVTTVSDECGNSPSEIERRYRKKGVTMEAAQEFFGILPPVQAEIILMPIQSEQLTAATA